MADEISLGVAKLEMEEGDASNLAVDGRVGSKLYENVTCSSSIARETKSKTYGETKKIVEINTVQHATEYNMNHPNRGKALILNHEIFDSHLKMGLRKGTNEDKKALMNLFKSLEFDVECYDNLTKSQLRDKLKQVAKEDHSLNDCFVCCLLTHGENGIFYAKDNKYASEELWSPFLGNKCPSLAGKPKLFFVQACQGDLVDDGVTVRTSNVETDSASVYKIPSHADFLIAFSTVAGYYSWRNTTNGSWFIQSLCKILKENSHNTDLLTLMTMVNYEVAFKFQSNVPTDYSMDLKKQIPSITTMLTRKIFFRPKG